MIVGQRYGILRDGTDERFRVEFLGVATSERVAEVCLFRVIEPKVMITHAGRGDMGPVEYFATVPGLDLPHCWPAPIRLHRLAEPLPVVPITRDTDLGRASLEDPVEL